RILGAARYHPRPHRPRAHGPAAERPGRGLGPGLAHRHRSGRAALRRRRSPRRHGRGGRPLMGRLVLVLHAEAAGNPEHRFIGQTDVALTGRGRRRAEAVGLRLRSVPVDRVVSSDLMRAADTAAAIAGVLDRTVELEPRLREIHNGEWAGLTPEEILAGWPDMFTRYRGGEDV